MKKHFIIGLSILFVCTNIYAGPFGLEMGMSLKSVKEACNGRDPVKIDDGTYFIIPQKPHPYFTKYIVWISESEGLHYIKAIGADISTSVYGTALRTKFEDICSSLIKIYGNGDSIDFLMSKSIWDESNDWMRALQKDERTLAYVWDRKYQSTLPDSIQTVFLNANATDTETGYLILEYGFINHEKADQIEKDKIDTVF